jgi:hypothetical protein
MSVVFFTLTVFVLPGLPMGATAPRWAFLSLACAWMFFDVRLRCTVWIIIAYLGAMALITPVGYDAAFIYWHFLLLAVLFCARVDPRKAVIGTALGFAVNSAAVVGQYFGWQRIPEIAPLSGLFFNRNLASEGAAMALALVVGYRLWWLVPGILPTLVAGSRAPLLGLGVVALIALWRTARVREAIALLFVLASVLFICDPSTASMQQRLGAWQDALHGLTIFGRGLGSFIGEFPRWQLHSNPLVERFENAHNDILQLVFELGIGGAILVGLFLVGLARASSSPAWYALVVFAVEGLFGFPLYEPVSGALAAVCAGSVFGGGGPVFSLFALERCRIWARYAQARLAQFRLRRAVVSAGAQPSFGSGLLGDNNG